MTEIYIVTSGCYSDYRIEAVFTSKADAEALAATDADECTGYCVETYELDAVADKARQGLTPWEVACSLSGVASAWQTHPREVQGEGHTRFWAKGISVLCWARDEQHACKIAMEKWAQWKAETV